MIVGIPGLSVVGAAGTWMVFAGHRKRAESPEQICHPVRKRMMDWIRRRPGIRLSGLWKELGANRGTAQYHLLVLERAGVIRTLREGRATRYFPVETPAADLPALALLLRGRVLEVARLLLESPGISQHDLTATLDISRRVFREYADLLKELDFIDEVRDARVKRYFPRSALSHFLDRLEERESGGTQEGGLEEGTSRGNSP